MFFLIRYIYVRTAKGHAAIRPVKSGQSESSADPPEPCLRVPGVRGLEEPAHARPLAPPPTVPQFQAGARAQSPFVPCPLHRPPGHVSPPAAQSLPSPTSPVLHASRRSLARPTALRGARGAPSGPGGKKAAARRPQSGDEGEATTWAPTSARGRERRRVLTRARAARRRPWEEGPTRSSQ